MEFRILGPFEVYTAGQAVPLGGAKQRALLAVLLLSANHVVSVDRLIDELWGEQPPATAAHTIQVYVSQLRKVLEAPEVLVTRSPGYLLRVESDELDLHRFERMLEEGRRALGEGDAETAAARLREALSLWRGDALADFSFEPFAQAAISRLDELRLAAVEDRIEADLALGRHADVIGELSTLIGAHPLRERPRAQSMLALYRSGRQAEALQAYQEARGVLVDELGIDPSPALQELEMAILNQDGSLALEPAGSPVAKRAREEAPAPERSILVHSESDEELERLLRVAEPLARSRAPHELILARVLRDPRQLGPTTSKLQVLRSELLERGTTARAAAFVSDDVGADVVRLASQQEVDLLLVAAGTEALDESSIDGVLRTLLEDAACDVAVLAGAAKSSSDSDGAVLVPFGAGEHDWGALELGAWAASAHDVALRLLGAEADEEAGRRDASRLLATASLAVQQLAGVVTEPLLAPAGERGVLDAATGTQLVVLGLSERWRAEGAGPVRWAIAQGAPVPVLLVRRGVRPGGLSPQEGLTRYTWSLSESAP
jgi:DNA-binding SARP family transcriptional activator